MGPPRQGLILLLEDDARSADALARVLEDWGYACIHAGALAEALDLLGPRAWTVAAVISDYHLDGGATGLDALRQARALGISAPMLLLTGSLRGQARRAAAAAGFEFLEKPVAPHRLQAWLQRVTVDRNV